MTPGELSPLRAAVGRFAYHNCFQEALLPVLTDRLGAGPAGFSDQRFIGAAETVAALRKEAEPGLFGGTPWPDLARRYRIRFGWASRPPFAPADLPAGGTAPAIAIVDRFHVPTDRLCYQRVHRPHTLLIVGADAGGVYYSDAEYPLEPAPLPYPALATALAEGHGRGPFLVAVEDCGQPEPDVIVRWRSRAQRDLLADLADAAVFEDLHRTVGERMARALGLAEPLDRELAGGDVAALVNAVAVSYTHHGGQATAVVADQCRRIGAALSLAHRFCLMAAESGRERYLERADRALADAARWAAGPSREGPHG